MEILESCPVKSICNSIYRPSTYPMNAKCTRRYVQPPRVTSFAPQRTYCPPTSALEAKTTYHLSYLSADRCPRAKSIRPMHCIDMTNGKFTDDTTTKLSYKPVWGIVKSKPIIPRRRPITNNTPMQNMTTVRHDYIAKYIPKPNKIVPSGHIRISSSPLDNQTTTHLSYMKPDPIQPVTNFKPQRKYYPPEQPIHKETTHKLSFQPIQVSKREIYPWAQKPVYRSPNLAMIGETTYLKSYLKNDVPREKPIFPSNKTLFPYGAEFTGKTVYNESFLHSYSEPVVPIVRNGNITLSDKKMDTDTTNKLSFQAIQAKKRNPIIPQRKKMIGDGPMECITTAKHDFTLKAISPPEMIMPCLNIHTADQPFEDKTTFALSFMNPGFISQIPNFKPIFKYNKPTEKIDTDTVNKLSYQQWQLHPKENLPWAQKRRYESPKESMMEDSVYHTSYPPPGYYTEVCESENHPSSDEQNENSPKNS